MFDVLRNFQRHLWGGVGREQGTDFDSTDAGRRVNGSHTDAAARSRDRTLACAYSLLLIALCVLIYHPVVKLDFLDFDDHVYVQSNPAIGRGMSVETVIDAFTDVYFFSWQPLAVISHAIDVELFGYRPAFHHATSVALHLLNSLLVFWLTTRMVGSAGAAAWAGVFFLVHPQHVEAVVWISSRQHLLSATFFLLCLLAYLEYARRRGATEYVLVVATFCAALLSKAMLMTVPFVLLLLDVWPLKRLNRPADLVRLVGEKLPLFGISLLMGVILHRIQSGSGLFQTVSQVPFWVRIDNAVMAYGKYALHAFVPVDLSFFYPHTMGRTPVAALVTVALVLLLITVAAAAVRKSAPMVLVCWLWFLGMLVPVCGLLIAYRYQGLADRYTYVPHIGLIVGVVASAHGLNRYGRARTLSVVGVLFALAFVVLSAQRVPLFRNDVVLFTQAIERNPVNPRAALLCGNRLMAAGYHAEAISMFHRTLETTMWMELEIDAHESLARAYHSLGAATPAHSHCLEALPHEEGLKLIAIATEIQSESITSRISALESRSSRKQEDPELAMELARLYALEARVDEALEMYNRAEQNGARSFAVADGRTQALSIAGRYDEALEVAQLARYNNAGLAEAEYLYGRTLYRAGRFAESRAALAASMQLHPTHGGIIKFYQLIGHELQ